MKRESYKPQNRMATAPTKINTHYMLAEILETFVIYQKDIAQNGLIVSHHDVTEKYHHIDICDKAILLTNELGLIQKGRFPFKPKPDPELEKFMRGPKFENGQD